jgi:hypothetical protein
MGEKLNTNNKILISIIAFFLLISIASAGTLVRQAPTSVQPGQSFSVTYSVSDMPAPSNWFVNWEETIIGGCTPTPYKDFMAKEGGGSKSQTTQFTAPSSGSCVFNGYFLFAGGASTNLPSFTVNVISPACTLGQTQSCTATNGCSGTQSCSANSQWAGCSTTLTKCSDNSCQASCPIVTCNAGATQACTMANGCAGTQTCSNNAWGTCSQTTPSCGSSGTNQTAGFDYCGKIATPLANKIPFSIIDDDCTQGTVWLIAAFILLMVLIK